MSTSPDDLFEIFVNQCQQNLHVVLLFSPSGDTLRQRIQLFPSLVNCCTIDWYSTWDLSSLEAVAHQELRSFFLNPPGYLSTLAIFSSSTPGEKDEREGGEGTERPPTSDKMEQRDREKDRLETDEIEGDDDEEEESGKGEERETKREGDASEMRKERKRKKTGSLLAGKMKDVLCHIFAEIQLDVMRITEKYLHEMKRYNYVTPASYVEFLKLFTHLNSVKSTEIQRQMSQYKSGLEKINSTSRQVAKIQSELEILKPQIIQSSKETSQLMDNIARIQQNAAASKVIKKDRERDWIEDDMCRVLF